MKITTITEKLGWLGTIVSAMGCAFCFPALGVLGSAVGLGFMVQFEGTLIHYLLPIFASITLVSAFIAWLPYKKVIRLASAMLGPIIVLATIYLFWSYPWRNYLFYTGLILMVGISIWNLISPPVKTCKPKK